MGAEERLARRLALVVPLTLKDEERGGVPERVALPDADKNDGVSVGL